VSAIAVCLVAFLGFVPRPSEVERRFRDYMQAVDRQELGEWKTAIGSRFDFEIVAVRGDRLIARIVETNRLYSALDVGRLVVSEYVLDGDAIRETQVLEVHETGRPWDEARRELEAWLSTKPSSDVSGLLTPEGLAFTGESGRRLVPLLEEWKRLTDEACRRNEPVVASFVEALNRHDVEAQFQHYTADVTYKPRVLTRRPIHRLRRASQRKLGIRRWFLGGLGDGRRRKRKADSDFERGERLGTLLVARRAHDFLSGMNDVYVDIYSMDADGSNVRQLTRWTEIP